MTFKPNTQRTIIPFLPQLSYLLQILCRRYSVVPSFFNGVEIVQKRRCCPVDLVCYLVESRRDTPAKLALKERGMQIFVYDIPMKELSFISTHHWIYPLIRRCTQVVCRKSSDPRWFVFRIVPKNIMPTNCNTARFCEFDQGIRNRVVFGAPRFFGGVPIWFNVITNIGLILVEESSLIITISTHFQIQCIWILMRTNSDMQCFLEYFGWLRSQVESRTVVALRKQWHLVWVGRVDPPPEVLPCPYATVKKILLITHFYLKISFSKEHVFLWNEH